MTPTNSPMKYKDFVNQRKNPLASAPSARGVNDIVHFSMVYLIITIRRQSFSAYSFVTC